MTPLKTTLRRRRRPSGCSTFDEIKIKHGIEFQAWSHSARLGVRIKKHPQYGMWFVQKEDLFYIIYVLELFFRFSQCRDDYFD